VADDAPVADDEPVAEDAERRREDAPFGGRMSGRRGRARPPGEDETSAKEVPAAGMPVARMRPAATLSRLAQTSGSRNARPPALNRWGSGRPRTSTQATDQRAPAPTPRPKSSSRDNPAPPYRKPNVIPFLGLTWAGSARKIQPASTRRALWGRGRPVAGPGSFTSATRRPSCEDVRGCTIWDRRAAGRGRRPHRTGQGGVATARGRVWLDSILCRGWGQRWSPWSQDVDLAPRSPLRARRGGKGSRCPVRIVHGGGLLTTRRGDRPRIDPATSGPLLPGA